MNTDTGQLSLKVVAGFQLISNFLQYFRKIKAYFLPCVSVTQKLQVMKTEIFNCLGSHS